MNNLTPLHSAIISIVNDEPSHFFFRGDPTYENLIWVSETIPKPTEEEVNQKIEELRIERERTEYQRQRAPEYPSVKEQLDALFHAGFFPPEMAAKIQEVKDKYPKPE